MVKTTIVKLQTLKQLLSKQMKLTHWYSSVKIENPNYLINHIYKHLRIIKETNTKKNQFQG